MSLVATFLEYSVCGVQHLTDILITDLTSKHLSHAQKNNLSKADIMIDQNSIPYNRKLAPYGTDGRLL